MTKLYYSLSKSSSQSSQINELKNEHQKVSKYTIYVGEVVPKDIINKCDWIALLDFTILQCNNYLKLNDIP